MFFIVGFHRWTLLVRIFYVNYIYFTVWRFLLESGPIKSIWMFKRFEIYTCSDISWYCAFLLINSFCPWKINISFRLLTEMSLNYWRIEKDMNSNIKNWIFLFSVYRIQLDGVWRAFFKAILTSNWFSNNFILFF